MGNTTLKQMMEWLRADMLRLEDKVDKLQGFRWKVIGYSTACGTIVSALLVLLVKLI